MKKGIKAALALALALTLCFSLAGIALAEDIYFGDDGDIFYFDDYGNMMYIDQSGNVEVYDPYGGVSGSVGSDSYYIAPDGTYYYYDSYTGRTYTVDFYGNRRYVDDYYDYNTPYTRSYTSYTVRSVNLDSHSITLPAWSSRTLYVNVSDDQANYSVSWSSSNNSVAYVSGNDSYATVSSNGVNGTATITASVYDRNTGRTLTDSCTVRVEAEKVSSYSPRTNLVLNSTTKGTTIYDSLRNQFRAVYGTPPSDSATITFGASSSNIAARYLSSGQPVRSGTNYTMSQYKGMYTEASAAGTFSTPYTLREGNNSLTGDIYIDISAPNAMATLTLSGSSPYIFNNMTATGDSGAEIVTGALKSVLGTRMSWSYLTFQASSSAIGTLYTNTGLTPITSSTISAASLNNLYFVPASAGTYTIGFQAFTGSGGVVCNGTLYITVPAAAPAPAPAPAAAPQVQRTSQSLKVNGAPVSAEIYNINGNNYFKLRDVAMMLNGTGSQFAVYFDAGTGTISVTPGLPYAPQGGELTVGEDKSASCVASSMPIFINSIQQYPTAYNLGGNNFLQLRDLGSLLNFSVDFDAASNTILVTSR